MKKKLKNEKKIILFFFLIFEINPMNDIFFL